MFKKTIFSVSEGPLIGGKTASDLKGSIRRGGGESVLNDWKVI